MRIFQFRVDQPDQQPLIKFRKLSGYAEAMAYARQLLGIGLNAR